MYFYEDGSKMCLPLKKNVQTNFIRNRVGMFTVYIQSLKMSAVYYCFKFRHACARNFVVENFARSH